MMENKEKGVARMGQQGFTLVELIVVIVILGIIAVVAIPKYIDLQEDAKKSAVAGVAGALSSASAVNKSAQALGKAATVANCGAVGGLLETPGLPTDYTITGTAPDCVVSGPGGYTASFVGYTTS